MQQLSVNEDIYKICKLAIDKYPKILDRISKVELYYLCENFRERDKYNQNKRTDKETADKLISFAKGECVSFSDIESLKKQKFDYVQHVKENKDQIFLGNGGENLIYFLEKNSLFETKKTRPHITFAIKNRSDSEVEVSYNTYNEQKICSKILLSLFARQTKYYNTFIMKEMKKIDKIPVSFEQDQNTIDEKVVFDKNFKDITEKEKSKEIAREFFFSMGDHYKSREVSGGTLDYQNGNMIYVLYTNLYKNRMLDRDGHIVDIDLAKILATKKYIGTDDCKSLYNFVKDNKLGNLSEILSNLKKNLTISPKLIAYHTLNELSKYEFKDFNDEKYVNCIKDVLNTYQSLLSETKDNFTNIDNDVVNICNNQLKIYEKYINKIQSYTLDDFKNDFKTEETIINAFEEKQNQEHKEENIINNEKKEVEKKEEGKINNNLQKQDENNSISINKQNTLNPEQYNDFINDVINKTTGDKYNDLVIENPTQFQARTNVCGFRRLFGCCSSQNEIDLDDIVRTKIQNNIQTISCKDLITEYLGK